MRIPHFLSAFAAALALACTGDRSKDADASTTFRVALLTPGPITDHSWNAGAYSGLLEIRDSLGAEISHIQTKTPAEFEENFREYGKRGYSLIFGHGFEFQDAVRRVAPLFPKSVYVVTSSQLAGPNFAGIRFAFEEPAYIAGMIAASVSRTGVIGLLGGTELPPVHAGFTAFRDGVRRVRPESRILVSFVGNWDDASAAKEQALAQIAQGADVIFQNADAAGLGVFQAAREKTGVVVIGSNSDQNGVAPDVVLGSVVIDLPRAYLTVARVIRDGRFTGSVFELGAASEVVRYVANPAMPGRVPHAAQVTADSVWQAFVNGSFHLDPDEATRETSR
ncbi:MAG: Purine-binding protein [Gemmatimonadaceae bacterium]|nr:Purine-binding protein [Gemmatimonadaceae bacterium]